MVAKVSWRHLGEASVNEILTSDKLLPDIFPLVRSASDEVNNLESVPVVEFCLRPLTAANDVLVELDCNSVGRQKEFLNQITQRRLIRQLTTFSIDLNVQCFID